MRKVSILIGICMLAALAITIWGQERGAPVTDLSPVMKDVAATQAKLRMDLMAGNAADVAADADKLQGGIIVRLANPNEKFLALDGKTYSLGKDDLVIADEARAVAIAGSCRTDSACSTAMFASVRAASSRPAHVSTSSSRRSRCPRLFASFRLYAGPILASRSSRARPSVRFASAALDAQ